jgi:hypothetical protein
MNVEPKNNSYKTPIAEKEIISTARIYAVLLAIFGPAITIIVASDPDRGAFMIGGLVLVMFMLFDAIVIFAFFLDLIFILMIYVRSKPTNHKRNIINIIFELVSVILIVSVYGLWISATRR